METWSQRLYWGNCVRSTDQILKFRQSYTTFPHSKGVGPSTDMFATRVV